MARLSRGELDKRRELALRLLQDGVTAEAIAVRFGVTSRSVHRWRQKEQNRHRCGLGAMKGRRKAKASTSPKSPGKVSSRTFGAGESVAGFPPLDPKYLRAHRIDPFYGEDDPVEAESEEEHALHEALRSATAMRAYVKKLGRPEGKKTVNRPGRDRRTGGRGRGA